MAEEVYRIDVTVQVQDKYSNELKGAERTVSRFEQRMKRTEQQLDRMNRGRWRLMLSAVDRASHVINRVGMFADRVARRSYRIAIRAVDMFTSPVRSMLSSMSGILATAGIVGGTAGGLILPIKMQVERQNVTTQFEILLGSAEKAQQRIKELTEFASQTPYTRDEIYQASRVLEIFTEGALSTGEGLRLVGDIAAGTQREFADVALWMGRLYSSLAAGRPIGQELSWLEEIGAISGDARKRIEELAASGKDITRIWPEVVKEFSKFDGMMEKMSKNLGNLLLSVRSFFMENIIMRWGQGLDSVLSPLLTDFRNWRQENSDLIQAMGDSIEQAGRRFAGFFDTIFRSVGRNFDELIRLPEFQEADFIGKLKLSWDRLITQPLSEWWESGGQDQVGRITGNIGHFIGSSLNAVIMSALGLTGVEGSDTGSVYKDIGTTAGRSFLEGFLEGFDANEVTKKLWEAFKNIQPSFLGGQTQSLGGTIMALLFDAWLITRLAGLFRGPATIAKGIGRGARGLWRAGKNTFNWARDTRRGGPRGSLGGSPLIPNITRLPTTGSRSEGLMSRIRNMFRGGPGGPSGPTPIPALGFARRLPVPGLNILSLIGTSQEALPGAIGGIGGGMAGSMIGAALGSMILPGIGTAVGSMAGGILGSKLGEKIGGIFGQGDILESLDNLKTTASSKFAEIKESAIEGLKELPGSVAEQFGYAVGYAEQKMSQLPGRIGSWAEQTVASIASWFSNLPSNVSTWWSGVYASISSWAQYAYNSVTTWIGGIPGAIKSAFERAREAWGGLKTWISDKWQQVKSHFSEGRSRGQEPAKRYAHGGLISSPHLGLVGEEGPEMIIPLSAARRNRALELWMQTAKYLGVRQYADGGITSPTAPVEPVSTSKGGAVNINVNVGGVSVQISTEKIDTTNKEETAEEIAFEISRKLQEILGNMPIVNTI